jgi:hypothetical protein
MKSMLQFRILTFVASVAVVLVCRNFKDLASVASARSCHYSGQLPSVCAPDDSVEPSESPR